MNTPIIAPPQTIKDRLRSLLEIAIEKSEINSAFKPAIGGLAKKYLDSLNEENLQALIFDLRDKFIPWILTGNMPGGETDENSSGD